MELRAVTEELLRRLPDITAEPEPPEYLWDAGNIMSIARVSVTFTPVAVSVGAMAAALS